MSVVRLMQMVVANRVMEPCQRAYENEREAISTPVGRKRMKKDFKHRVVRCNE